MDKIEDLMKQIRLLIDWWENVDLTFLNYLKKCNNKE